LPFIIDVTVIIPSALFGEKFVKVSFCFFMLIKKQSFAIWADRMILMTWEVGSHMKLKRKFGHTFWIWYFFEGSYYRPSWM